jgi:hypothetical protein
MRSQSFSRTFQSGEWMMEMSQVHLAAVVQDAHVGLHADAVVPPHVDAGGARDLDLAGDLGIDAPHRHELVLGEAVERAAAGDADVHGVLRIEHRAPPARELGVVW